MAQAKRRPSRTPTLPTSYQCRVQSSKQSSFSDPPENYLLSHNCDIYDHIFVRCDRSGTDGFQMIHFFPLHAPLPIFSLPQGGFVAIHFTYDTGRKIILHSFTDSVPQVTSRTFVRQFSPSMRVGWANVLPKKHVSNRNFQMQASSPRGHGTGLGASLQVFRTIDDTSALDVDEMEVDRGLDGSRGTCNDKYIPFLPS